MILLFSLSVSVFAIVQDFFWCRSNRVANHVTFCGEDLSGASAEQAKRLIDVKIKSRSKDSVVLDYRDQAFEFSCADLGFPRDGTQLYQKALMLGREGGFVSRFLFRLKSLGNEVELERLIEIDTAELQNILSVVRDELKTTAKNAHFSIADDGSVSIVPSEKGTYLDADRSAQRISAALCDFHTDSVALIIAENSDPAQTTEDLEQMHINGVLSSFTTYYSESAANRAHNISLAAARLNGLVIMAGESFSFNHVVGPRGYEQGFLDAVIIENGRYTDGLGGGVCQVSTTVYGAILRTELEVMERRPHSLVSGYVEPGQDAMVSWGISDLVFVNTYETPILLSVKCGGGVLTVSVYGDVKEKKDVSVQSEITRYIPYKTETIVDKSLPSGSRYVRSSGKRGLECSVYRTISKNGEILKTETVSHDIYAAQKKIVVSGP